MYTFGHERALGTYMAEQPAAPGGIAPSAPSIGQRGGQLEQECLGITGKILDLAETRSPSSISGGGPEPFANISRAERWWSVYRRG